MNSFNELELSAALLQGVDVLGYQQMTPIQAQALPLMLQGRDVLAQAKTGSGKTAAFGLALLNALEPEQVRVQSLVLCPTRELADQVAKELRALARFIPNIKVLSLCGGISIRPQLASLKHEPHVVVGTPGRIEDLLKREALNLNDLQTVVLDEADRMLDMGFLDAVERILGQVSRPHRTWLFSATYPEQIKDLSRRFQRDPATVTVAATHVASVIEQCFYRVEPADKPAAVLRLLNARQPESCLIFCHTRQDVRSLQAALNEAGVPVLALHGDLDQREREEALVRFANGSCRVLVATDVAARGLDIKALPMVLAYELPADADIHVHRIGRTGRAGERGLALTLVASREQPRVLELERAQGLEVSWAEIPPARGARPLPPPSMRTLVIDAGRRDKLRPGDILGALTGTAGLSADEVGQIDLFATRAYVAVSAEVLGRAIRGLREGGIKGRKARVRAF